MAKVSIIITTYNWHKALQVCLESLLIQQISNFEIIIADDGSNQETTLFIEQFVQFNPNLSILHVRHEDHGFRAGTIRNKAVAKSSGDYLIFLDGDCVTFKSFLVRHLKLAEPGYFVPGNRILLSEQYSKIALDANIPLHKKPILFFLTLWLNGHINRFLPLVFLPFNFFRYLTPLKWQKAMTCNLALWKKDFIAVNGFDEKFEGWGYEDSDLIIRLIHNGIKRKEGRFAVPVLHLWHKQNDRSKHDENYQRLLKRINKKTFIKAEKGINQYL